MTGFVLVYPVDEVCEDVCDLGWGIGGLVGILGILGDKDVVMVIGGVWIRRVLGGVGERERERECVCAWMGIRGSKYTMLKEVFT